MIPAGGHRSAEAFGPRPGQAVRSYSSSAFMPVCLCSRVPPITFLLGLALIWQHGDLVAFQARLRVCEQQQQSQRF